eukprot:scaffold23950_cov63-Phaeocystis_antarctica.AAC.3
MPPSAPDGARALTSQMKGGASRAWSSSCAQRGRSSGGDAEPLADVGARPVPDLQWRRQERKRLDSVDLHAHSQRRDRHHALAARARAWAWAAEHQLKVPCSKFTASLLEQLRGLSRCAEREPSVRLLACTRAQNVTDGLYGQLGRECARTTLVQDGKVPLLRLRVDAARCRLLWF